MKTLTLICGLPGNGKTTLAHKLSVFAVAADDFPGLYVDGVYQQRLQKDSHEWCKSQVEGLMIEAQIVSKHDIVVHNTFTRNNYRQPYIDLAMKYGYAVHVVTSEAVILPTGDRTSSVHNVPAEIVESMRNGWEPFNYEVGRQKRLIWLGNKDDRACYRCLTVEEAIKNYAKDSGISVADVENLINGAGGFIEDHTNKDYTIK